MKKITLSLMLFTLFVTSNAIAGPVCTAKAANIRKQINYAKQHNNTHQVAGLEKALQEVNQHCTDAGEYRDIQKKVTEAEKDVAEVKSDISERQIDIKEAQAKGDQKKVRKLQSKLASDQTKLREKQTALNNLRAEQAQMSKL